MEWNSSKNRFILAMKVKICIVNHVCKSHTNQGPIIELWINCQDLILWSYVQPNIAPLQLTNAMRNSSWVVLYWIVFTKKVNWSFCCSHCYVYILSEIWLHSMRRHCHCISTGCNLRRQIRNVVSKEVITGDKNEEKEYAE